ncbi:NAP1-related protein 2-like isoform X3 [Asparagus officinalis]|uniref:NAP1-related protein 2-like isoform X3 n=1 Tax=Asparagus officinalis TaxID=4686 RepID=UPI00098E4A66|nr:NAP1-related protein 2-like isoform X3 [Asparagus officinalis]
MVAADKGKKAKVAEGEENEQIDGELVISIEKLQEIQDELEKVNEEASDKVLEVEQKYNEIRRPVYKRRNEIIQSIPDFWLTAFLSHPALGDLLTEEDQKIFKHLISLDVEDSKDVKSGYTITFNFSANPYFEETKLEKTYIFDDEGTPNITGTKITWKEDIKSIPNGVEHEKGSKRPLTEESFFSWFGEMHDKSFLEGVFDEVGELIKEDLWPNPLRYFNNEADEEFDGDIDEKDSDDDENDDDDDDEE